jgi:transcriptional regulator with XRE-family HTH domain
MENISQNIGCRIKELRAKKNISQEALANSAGMARGFVSSVENGKRNITVFTLGKILAVLEESYFSFFNDKDFK